CRGGSSARWTVERVPSPPGLPLSIWPSQSLSCPSQTSAVGGPGVALHVVPDPFPRHTIAPVRVQPPTPTVQDVPSSGNNLVGSAPLASRRYRKLLAEEVNESSGRQHLRRRSSGNAPFPSRDGGLEGHVHPVVAGLIAGAGKGPGSIPVDAVGPAHSVLQGVQRRAVFPGRGQGGDIVSGGPRGRGGPGHVDRVRRGGGRRRAGR